MTNDPTHVEIRSADIYWEQIHVREITDKMERPANQPVGIQLEWGWTAGMSEEDLKNVAEDAPQGFDVLRITLSGAERLVERLQEVIAKHKEKVMRD